MADIEGKIIQNGASQIALFRPLCMRTEQGYGSSTVDSYTCNIQTAIHSHDISKITVLELDYCKLKNLEQLPT